MKVDGFVYLTGLPFLLWLCRMQHGDAATQIALVLFISITINNAMLLAYGRIPQNLSHCLRVA